MTRLQGFMTLQKLDKTRLEGFYDLPVGLNGTINGVCSSMGRGLWLACGGM